MVNINYPENHIDNLTETMEDYIEAIKLLQDEHKTVRVKHIAEKMNVKMPTVSSALSVLSRKNLVKYEKYDYVELTEEGEKIALSLLQRHKAVKRFLIDILQVDENIAEKDACGMEHHISKQTVDHILKFLQYIESCPRSENLCMKNFKIFLETGKRPKCIDDQC